MPFVTIGWLRDRPHADAAVGIFCPSAYLGHVPHGQADPDPGLVRESQFRHGHSPAEARPEGTVGDFLRHVRRTLALHDSSFGARKPPHASISDGPGMPQGFVATARNHPMGGPSLFPEGFAWLANAPHALPKECSRQKARARTERGSGRGAPVTRNLVRSIVLRT